MYFTLIQGARIGHGLGGARRGPMPPNNDDGWGWMEYGLRGMERANEQMGFGIGCLKRGVRVLKEEKEYRDIEERM